MKTTTRLMLGATALALFGATPALADKSDDVYIDQLREKIAMARGEPGVAQNGSAELDRAEKALPVLKEALDDNKKGRTEALSNEIDALIQTARVRAQVAMTKEEVERAKLAANNATNDRVASAEAAAAAAQSENAQLRQAMRDYQMKQTQLGATLVLQDVVFETGKADLKPGAAERLRPLATYLQGNPEVKVRIDGHTDAQGSDSYNQQLSNARAEAVRGVLASSGIDPARIQAVGHGEATPVADNTTAAGRQQNRRVEVTLVGQQAQSFAGLAQ